MPTLPALLALLLPCRGSLQAWPWLRALCMLVVALLGTAGAAHAQTFSFREYDQADGLQGMSVNGILEDRNGAVWVATETALHRFERDRFVPVGAEQGLDARYTRALTLDRAGRLWVATANGVFVRIGERFEQVQYNGRRIRADAGNVIAAYRNGVAVVSGNTLLALTLPPSPAGRCSRCRCAPPMARCCRRAAPCWPMATICGWPARQLSAGWMRTARWWRCSRTRKACRPSAGG